MSEENKMPFGLPIIASRFMPDDKVYFLNPPPPSIYEETSTFLERQIAGAFAIPPRVLTMEMLERNMERMWSNFEMSRPTTLLVSPQVADQVFLLLTFPSLFEAQSYRTPWERLVSRCKAKMREIESYSSHKAARLEEEPCW